MGSAQTGKRETYAAVRDVRMEASLTVAATRDVSIAVAVPLLWRTITSGDAVRNAASIGDIDARVAYSTVRDGGEGLVLTLGLRAPTAPTQFDALGRALSSELQPGCGAVTPYIGAMHVKRVGEWTLRYGGSIVLPFSVRDAPHPGDSIRGSATAQRRLLKQLAVRAGVSARLDLTGEMRKGVDDPNSGGLVGYATVGVSASPMPSVSMAIDTFVPAIQVLRGNHRESTVFALSVGYAF